MFLNNYSLSISEILTFLFCPAYGQRHLKEGKELAETCQKLDTIIEKLRSVNSARDLDQLEANIKDIKEKLGTAKPEKQYLEWAKNSFLSENRLRALGDSKDADNRRDNALYAVKRAIDTAQEMSRRGW